MVTSKELKKIRRENLQPRYWVTMTDRFMSGWGRSKGKTNKFVVAVPTYNQADIIRKNAKLRSEMKYVNITSRKPRYNRRNYLVSMKGWGQLGDIWKKY